MLRSSSCWNSSARSNRMRRRRVIDALLVSLRAGRWHPNPGEGVSARRRSHLTRSASGRANQCARCAWTRVDGLDHAVLGPGDRLQTAAETVDPLMVPGADLGRRHFEDLGDAAAGLDPHRMRSRPSGWQTVQDALPRPRRADAGAACRRGDVQDLHAAADAEQRQVRPRSSGGAARSSSNSSRSAETDVDGLVRHAAVHLGRDVAAAGEDQPVDDDRAAARGRSRPAAAPAARRRRRARVDVAHGSVNAGGSLVVAVIRRDADQDGAQHRLRPARSSGAAPSR
jgi:hypothetical protein